MRKVIAMLFMLLLVGCSGGGGGSAEPNLLNSAPSIPSGINVSSSAVKNIITWQPVSGATSYNIYWSTSPNVTTGSNKIINASSPYVHSGLTDKSVYYYAVTALKDNSESELSPIQNVTAAKVVSIEGGGDSVIALKSDGTVWTWGHLGSTGTDDGSVYNSTIPRRVSGLSSVTKVSAGGNHYVVLKADGTVWAWGFNNRGQLGNGTFTDSTVPVRVDIADVIDISCGYNFTLAVKRDGTMWGWGSNVAGELGVVSISPYTDFRTMPVQVESLSEVVSINAKSCNAVRSNGTLWEWSNGRLPQVIPNVGGVKKAQFNFVLTNSGTALGKGSLNQFFGLGINGAMLSVSEYTFLPNIDSATDLSYSNDLYKPFTFVKNDGTVWTLVPNSENIYSFVKVNPVDDALAMTTTSSCIIVLRRDGTLVGWGSGNYNILGAGYQAATYLDPVIIKGL